MKIQLPRSIKQLAYIIPYPLAFKLRFFWKHRYWPNINTPRSLTEKILWLMIWDRNPLRALVVDRIKVRHFVREKAPRCNAPAQLWIGESLSLEIWNQLPQKFVLKANHGSKMTCIVDKDVDSFETVSQVSNAWRQNDYSKLFGEWVYQDVPRVLIAEEKLELDGKVPPDWKFFCANGEVFLVMMNTDRTEHSEIDTFYLPDFTRLDQLSMDYDYRKKNQVFKPECFDEALQIARQLSANFDFIRVDLYLIGQTVYFGELTCFPAAGMDAIKPTQFDLEFGDKIRLDTSHVVDEPRPVWTKFSEINA